MTDFRVPQPLSVPPSTERELSARLRAHGKTPRGSFPILQAALDIAAHARVQANLAFPDFQAVIDTMDQLSRAAGDWVAVYSSPPSAEDQVEWLRQVMEDQGGFVGAREDYEAAENADIVAVIDRRRGLPVSLGLLYIHLARCCNFDVEGLNFPGHFLLRLNTDGGSAIFDPFNDARILQPQDLRATLKQFHGPAAEMDLSFTRGVGDREVLIRVQNNLKFRAMRESRLEDAIVVLERLLLMDPGNGIFWQEAGLTHQRLGNLRAAVLALENAIETAQEPALSIRVQSLLDEVRSQLN